MTPPHTEDGYQQPYHGQNFAGIFLYFLDNREYIEVGLTQSLKAGKRYCLRFRYAYADSSTLICDGLGAFFSVDSLMDPTQSFLALPVIPQVSHPDSFLVVDTANWLTFHESFIAQGGERFVTIGNFKPTFTNYLVQIRPDPNEQPRCYMFIDAVEVFECDTNGNPVYVEPPDTLQPSDTAKALTIGIYPNPAGNYFTIVLDTSSDVSIELYDVTGRLLYSAALHEKEITIPTKAFANGLYLLKVQQLNKAAVLKKMVVQRE